MTKLEGIRVAILATDGFEESELLEPRRVLEKAGARTSVIAPRTGSLQGMRHHERSGTVPVDETLERARPEQFDALLLPGGALNADALRADPLARAFAKAIDSAGKPIAVICHGPWLLASAGLVEGRTLTSYPTIREDLERAGARWVDREVALDGNWVSSRSPGDLPAFGSAMVALFAAELGREGRAAA